MTVNDTEIASSPPPNVLSWVKGGGGEAYNKGDLWYNFFFGLSAQNTPRFK